MAAVAVVVHLVILELQGAQEVVVTGPQALEVQQPKEVSPVLVQLYPEITEAKAIMLKLPAAVAVVLRQLAQAAPHNQAELVVMEAWE